MSNLQCDDPLDGYDWPEDEPICETCGNLGELECCCGGDFCVCLNYGSYPCPDCQL